MRTFQIRTRSTSRRLKSALFSSTPFRFALVSFESVQIPERSRASNSVLIILRSGMEAIREANATGNLVFDAQIAALCRTTSGVTLLVTEDRDLRLESSLAICTPLNPDHCS